MQITCIEKPQLIIINFSRGKYLLSQFYVRLLQSFQARFLKFIYTELGLKKCLIFSSLDLAYTLFIYSSLFIKPSNMPISTTLTCNKTLINQYLEFNYKTSNMPISTILTCNKILINLYLEFKDKTSNMHISTTLTCNKILINQYFINPMNICKKTRPTMLVS